jgi:hypothetical protein
VVVVALPVPLLGRVRHIRPRACTGWSPPVDLDAGLAVTVEAYRAACQRGYEHAPVAVG